MTEHRTILLVRHPQAQKNVEDRHGGEGTNLTEVGIEQCNMIARYVLSKYNTQDQCQLIGHKTIQQVYETVKCLSVLLNVIPIWDERLRGLNLGVLANLSRVEAAQRWPEAAKQLELWRRGQMQIDQLNIPNSEPLETFQSRIKAMLTEWIEAKGYNLLIAVCSRSTLIMLVNLIQMGEKFNYTFYKAFEFGDASLTTIKIKGSYPEIISLNTFEHLA